MLYKMDNSYYVLKRWIQNCVNTGSHIIKAFVKERFFHIEFFAMEMTILRSRVQSPCRWLYHRCLQLHSLDWFVPWLCCIVAGEPFPASEFEPLYCLAASRRANAAYVCQREEVLFIPWSIPCQSMPSGLSCRLQGDYLLCLTWRIGQMIRNFINII